MDNIGQYRTNIGDESFFNQSNSNKLVPFLVLISALIKELIKKKPCWSGPL